MFEGSGFTVPHVRDAGDLAMSCTLQMFEGNRLCRSTCCDPPRDLAVLRQVLPGRNGTKANIEEAGDRGREKQTSSVWKTSCFTASQRKMTELQAPSQHRKCDNRPEVVTAITDRKWSLRQQTGSGHCDNRPEVVTAITDRKWSLR